MRLQLPICSDLLVYKNYVIAVLSRKWDKICDFMLNTYAENITNNLKNGIGIITDDIRWFCQIKTGHPLASLFCSFY